jgi:hypothetical protein
LVTDTIKKVGIQIDIAGVDDFTALELRQFMHNAGIGLSRQTIQKYLEEAFFEHLIAPIAWKPGKGRLQVDKSILMNVARWKRGPSFDDIISNGSEVHAGPAHA